MIDRDAGVFQGQEVGGHIGPMAGRTSLRVRAALLGVLGAPGGRGAAAIPGDFGGDPLADPAVGRGIPEDVAVGMGVDVDEARADNQTRCVEDPAPLSVVQHPQSRDGVSHQPQVGLEGRTPGAIHHRAPFDDQVECGS